MRITLTVRLALVLMVLALITAAVSVTGASLLTRGAQLVQRVEPADEASAALFGDADQGTLIGSPQLLIVRDEAAFLPEGTVNGARLVNEKYLRERNIYPLQAKSVWFVRNLLLLTSLALFALGTVSWLIARRRNVRPSERIRSRHS